MRLDVFVAAELGAEFSRSQAARMIRAGLVRLNGAPARAADAVRAGDRIEIERPAAMPAAATPPGEADAPGIEVLYADDEVIVVNKPPGMTVHPAPGHPGGTLVDAMLARVPELAAMAEPGGVMRPGIVHRLDKDTSGVMVVARTPFARMELARQFKERTVSKIYLAVVRGVIGRERFSITRPVGRLALMIAQNLYALANRQAHRAGDGCRQPFWLLSDCRVASADRGGSGKELRNFNNGFGPSVLIQRLDTTPGKRDEAERGGCKDCQDN